MESSQVLQNVSKHISLERKEADYFISLLTEKEVKRKEIILEAGKPCTIINYVHSGVLRAFYRDREADESIIMFAINDWWVTDMFSFSTGHPAMLNIDALEDSTVLQLQKKDLDQLYLEVPKFERFFRIIMQNAYVREQLRIIENLSLTAEERYNNFLKKYPQFAQRVPLKQIASYLGVTPEFLSVVRKKATQR
jgi:Cyclic nucleotide-binding domain.